MALINIDLIGELAIQALQSKHLAESSCFNWQNDTVLTDTLFTRLYKTHKQASNLLDQLRKLHTVCQDMVNDNLQPYLDKHEEFADNDISPFNPFDEMTFFFSSNWIHDLPPIIEQYAELCSLAKSYQHIRQVQDEGFKKFFPSAEWHFQAEDEAGNTVYVTQSQVPENHLNQIESNRQIRAIEVEYCLDGYNDFFTQVQSAFDRFRPGNDIKGCAAFILSLYAPSKNKTDTLP